MSDEEGKLPEQDDIWATGPEVPQAKAPRKHQGAPAAPKRTQAPPPIPGDDDPEIGPGRSGGNMPGQLSRSEEAMAIQAQASDFKTRAREPREEKPGGGAGESARSSSALARASSMLRLASFSGACAWICLLVAAAIFFWPVFSSVIQGKQVVRAAEAIGLGGGQEEASAKGDPKVYTPGSVRTEDGEEVHRPGKGGKVQAAGGQARGQKGAGGATSKGGLMPNIPAGPLGPIRSLNFMIFSKPGQAEVILDGQPRGRTPVGANIECRENERVVVEMRKPGHQVWERVFRCKEGSIKVEGTLKKD